MKYFLILFSLLLSGCTSSWLETRASDLASSKAAYDKAEICCQSFSEMDFTLINEKGTNKLIVGREYQAFQFEEGKSFFRAVELPKLNYRYSINVEMWNTDSLGFSSSLMSVHNFLPTLVFLNDKFEEIKKLSDLNLRYQTWMTTAGWETDINITGELENARYVVIYTDPSLVGLNNTATPGDMTIMVGTIFIPIPSSDYAIPMNYEGIVNIEIDKL